MTLPIVEQWLTVPGRLSWTQFQALEQLLSRESAGVRVFYLDGRVELMSISPAHEIIKSILDALLVMFFCQQQIDAVPMGSATVQLEGRSVSVEPDLSYRLGGAVRFSNAANQSVIGTVLCEAVVPGTTAPAAASVTAGSTPTCAAGTTTLSL